MPGIQGIPIGYIQVRRCRAQHNQTICAIPKEFCRELGLTPGDYIEWTRYTDGSLRLRRYVGNPQPGDVRTLAH
jgi:hypothetical protein